MGTLEKLDHHPVHHTPNHHPPKMEDRPKMFLQIILAAKWRRPLPSLLSYSSSMDTGNQTSLTCKLTCKFLHSIFENFSLTYE